MGNTFDSEEYYFSVDGFRDWKSPKIAISKHDNRCRITIGPYFYLSLNIAQLRELSQRIKETMTE